MRAIRILDTTDRTHKREDHVRRTTCDLHRRVAKCTESDDEIFEHLL
jgi:hypothetical protein